MGLIGTLVLFFLLAGVAFFIWNAWLKTVEAPKPFGLDAFEAHDLGRASADVVKAVVATISFLDHPFTVVAEAKEACAAASAQATKAAEEIEENLENIQEILKENDKLQARVERANARAIELDQLVKQVGSFVSN